MFLLRHYHINDLYLDAETPVHQQTANYPFIHYIVLFLGVFSIFYCGNLYFFVLHFFQFTLFSCCILFTLHHFHVVPFLCYTLFMLHNFNFGFCLCCTLFMYCTISCCTLTRCKGFVLHTSPVAFLVWCTLFVLHYFQRCSHESHKEWELCNNN